MCNIELTAEGRTQTLESGHQVLIIPAIMSLNSRQSWHDPGFVKIGEGGPTAVDVGQSDAMAGRTTTLQVMGLPMPFMGHCCFFGGGGARH